MTQQPTVGRIVHFYAGHDIDHGLSAPWQSNYPSYQPLAAIITEVNPRLTEDARYALSVEVEGGTEIPNQDMIVVLDVRYPGTQAADPWPVYGPIYPYSETPKPGHWTWPPRT